MTDELKHVAQPKFIDPFGIQRYSGNAVIKDAMSGSVNLEDLKRLKDVVSDEDILQFMQICGAPVSTVIKLCRELKISPVLLAQPGDFSAQERSMDLPYITKVISPGVWHTPVVCVWDGCVSPLALMVRVKADTETCFDYSSATHLYTAEKTYEKLAIAFGLKNLRALDETSEMGRRLIVTYRWDRIKVAPAIHPPEEEPEKEKEAT